MDKKEYRDEYISFINSKLAGARPSGEYQKHHIIPKYLGGSDDITNMVLLTKGEHIRAHVLLHMTYGNEEDEYASLSIAEADAADFSKAQIIRWYDKRNQQLINAEDNKREFNYMNKHLNNNVLTKQNGKYVAIRGKGGLNGC